MKTAKNSTKSPQNSTNNSTISPRVEFVPRVEFSTPERPDVVEFDLGRAAAIRDAKIQSAQATANAKKFAQYSTMGEQELAALTPSELQAYKSSENKKKSEYTKRNSPMLHSVKLRLAVIDRAQELQKKGGAI